MDKMELKAVRICCGYNPDLRVNLNHPKMPGTKPTSDVIYDFLWEIFRRLYDPAIIEALGVSHADIENLTTAERDRLRIFLDYEAVCVAEGIVSDSKELAIKIRGEKK